MLILCRQTKDACARMATYNEAMLKVWRAHFSLLLKRFFQWIQTISNLDPKLKDNGIFGGYKLDSYSHPIRDTALGYQKNMRAKYVLFKIASAKKYFFSWVLFHFLSKYKIQESCNIYVGFYCKTNSTSKISTKRLFLSCLTKPAFFQD